MTDNFKLSALKRKEVVLIIVYFYGNVALNVLRLINGA